MSARLRPTHRFASCVLLACLVVSCAPGDAADDPAGEAAPLWREGPRLPQPIANNAVVAVAGPEGITVLSFLGIDSTKSREGVTDAAYRWDVSSGQGWREIGPVPGPGRLAPTAQAFGGRVFVFGGYTVADDGSERSLPDVVVYTPRTDAWASAEDMPVPVDDAASGVWASTSIYLVSGWSDTGNVRDVQVFDPSINRWSEATPIPGAPVFGHAGAIVGSDIVYVGGAKIVDGRPRFVVDSTAWRGRIDPLDPGVVDWEPIPPPPGPPLYRAGAVAAGGALLLVGGTDNPYNYDGIGYDGVAARPVSRAFAWTPRRGWSTLPSPPVATMDHRTLAVARDTVFVVGGMTADQRVSDRVFYADVGELLAAGASAAEPGGLE